MTRERFRNARKKHFAPIAIDMLNDSKLSLEAKGLLSILVSNTEDWEINMKEIITRSKNGRDAHYRILKELMAHGYYARVEIKNDKNQFEGIEHIFSDDKADVLADLEEFKGMANVFINLDKSKKKGPNPENQETGKSPEGKEEKPRPENQDTGSQKSESQSPADQYINNINPDYSNLNYINLNKINLSKEEEKLIDELYNNFSSDLSYSEIKIIFLRVKKYNPDNFNKYLHTAILGHIQKVREEHQNRQSLLERKGQIKPNVSVPDWLKPGNNSTGPVPEVDMEANRIWLENLLNGNGKVAE